MAHEIYKDRFVGVTPAWHRIGTAIEPGTTAQEAMGQARQLDWDVRAVPVKFHLDQMVGGVPIASPVDAQGLYVLVRNEEGKLQIASDQLVDSAYLPISNEDVFGPMVELMAGQSLPVDAAGVLGRLGNRAFMTFSAEGVEVAGGERYQRYLVALSGHTGRDAVRLIPTGVRVICVNTERLAISTASMLLSIAHNQKALDDFYADPDTARSVIGLSHEYNRRLEQMARDLQAVPFDQIRWDTVIETYMADAADPNTPRKQTNYDRKVASLRGAWDLEVARSVDLGQPFPTLWTAKQAASTWTQHLSRGGDAMHHRRAMNIAIGTPVPMQVNLEAALAKTAVATNMALSANSRPIKWLVGA